MTMSDGAGESIPLEISRGTPTPEELAAVVAVVTEHYATEHDEALAPESTRSAWELSQRGLRAPLDRDLGWRRTRC